METQTKGECFFCDNKYCSDYSKKPDDLSFITNTTPIILSCGHICCNSCAKSLHEVFSPLPFLCPICGAEQVKYANPIRELVIERLMYDLNHGKLSLDSLTGEKISAPKSEWHSSVVILSIMKKINVLIQSLETIKKSSELAASEHSQQLKQMEMKYQSDLKIFDQVVSQHKKDKDLLSQQATELGILAGVFTRKTLFSGSIKSEALPECEISLVHHRQNIVRCRQLLSDSVKIMEDMIKKQKMVVDSAKEGVSDLKDKLSTIQTTMVDKIASILPGLKSRWATLVGEITSQSKPFFDRIDSPFSISPTESFPSLHEFLSDVYVTLSDVRAIGENRLSTSNSTHSDTDRVKKEGNIFRLFDLTRMDIDTVVSRAPSVISRSLDERRSLPPPKKTIPANIIGIKPPIVRVGGGGGWGGVSRKLPGHGTHRSPPPSTPKPVKPMPVPTHMTIAHKINFHPIHLLSHVNANRLALPSSPTVSLAVCEGVEHKWCGWTVSANVKWNADDASLLSSRVVKRGIDISGSGIVDKSLGGCSILAEDIPSVNECLDIIGDISMNQKTDLIVRDVEKMEEENLKRSTKDEKKSFFKRGKKVKKFEDYTCMDSDKLIQRICEDAKFIRKKQNEAELLALGKKVKKFEDYTCMDSDKLIQRICEDAKFIRKKQNEAELLALGVSTEMHAASHPIHTNITALPVWWGDEICAPVDRLMHGQASSSEWEDRYVRHDLRHGDGMIFGEDNEDSSSEDFDRQDDLAAEVARRREMLKKKKERKKHHRSRREKHPKRRKKLTTVETGYPDEDQSCGMVVLELSAFNMLSPTQPFHTTVNVPASIQRVCVCIMPDSSKRRRKEDEYEESVLKSSTRTSPIRAEEGEKKVLYSDVSSKAPKSFQESVVLIFLMFAHNVCVIETDFSSLTHSVPPTLRCVSSHCPTPLSLHSPSVTPDAAVFGCRTVKGSVCVYSHYDRVFKLTRASTKQIWPITVKTLGSNSLLPADASPVDKLIRQGCGLSAYLASEDGSIFAFSPKHLLLHTIPVKLDPEYLSNIREDHVVIFDRYHCNLIPAPYHSKLSSGKSKVERECFIVCECAGENVEENKFGTVNHWRDGKGEEIWKDGVKNGCVSIWGDGIIFLGHGGWKVAKIDDVSEYSSK
ncbi:hypothetical protein ADUPG1_006238 [Aduncisulcus paluster]|uniref:RING-type domain-containing protein n=1 Tax=Aduncisulcus paluster TaxID=2918883 RepID=A0ABQ5KHC8_9EUKA|nr:hypothetical protein ADUPG1_006238 [Aduncisulcus paluster]